MTTRQNWRTEIRKGDGTMEMKEWLIIHIPESVKAAFKSFYGYDFDWCVEQSTELELRRITKAVVYECNRKEYLVALVCEMYENLKRKGVII